MIPPVDPQFSAACLSPGKMSAALDGVARAGGAEGAVLVFSRKGVSIQVVASSGLTAHVADYVAGHRPPDPRSRRVNPGFGDAFRLDQDDFSLREIESDPFYQEFLRPRGLGWHACAVLMETPEGEAVHLSLKRAFDRGPFARSELAGLAGQLPSMRMSVQFTHAATTFIASTAEGRPGAAGRSLIGYDARGEAFGIVLAPGIEAVVTLRRGMLHCTDPGQQGRLNATIARARSRASDAAVILWESAGRRWSFRIRPWPADHQTNMSFVAAISPLDFFVQPSADWLLTIRDLFDLSQAEARIAALVGQGLTVPEIAERLEVVPGTVRNQLKVVFAKAGVTRQAELSLLLSRL